MNPKVNMQISERFYSALDAVIAKGDIAGISTFCNLYDIDRRNLYTYRKNMDKYHVSVLWIYPLIKYHDVSAEWLITGYGRMFKSQNKSL